MSTQGAKVQILLSWQEPLTNVAESYTGSAPIVMGRDPTNQIVLSGGKISRQHTRIEARDEQCWVVDLGSTNGTDLNGNSIQAAQIQSGDTLQVGTYRFKVMLLDGRGQAYTIPSIDEDSTIPQGVATPPVEHTIAFNEYTDRTLALESRPGRRVESRALPASFQQQTVSIQALKQGTAPLDETTYLSIGGGLGSFTWIDHLRVYGVPTEQIVTVGFEPKPYGRYRRLCRNSQIPEYERLRSNSDSCPDNLWGWPGYAVREVWHELRQGDMQKAARVTWQIFGEPTFAETYTPVAGNVFDSIDREADRIEWEKMWRHGRVKAIRKTDDERYVIAYSAIDTQGNRSNRFIVAPYLHLAVGYPAIRLLNDLYSYREKYQDFKRVVNAYEPHDHVYEQLKKKGGIVLVRGRGIVASRIVQRLYETRRQNPNVVILHLMRSPLNEGQRYQRAQREVNEHWELQPFNWPKACWTGDLRVLLERANDVRRNELLDNWGGTTTAERQDWQDIVTNGLSEGWYRREFGTVKSVEQSQNQDKIITTIHGRGAVQVELNLEADFVIDGTGLESGMDSNPLLKDLLDHYQLERNPKGRFDVTNNFEIQGMRNGKGRAYASGVMTLGGPYAAVDSFLGLQYVAQRVVDDLTHLKAPSLRYLNGTKSISQWLRWVRGVQP